MRFFSQTFGCKVNQYESAWLSERFRERGYVQADSATVADVVVVHTCTVTSKSDAQCRQAIRKLVRENSKARVLVTGCYARLRPDDLRAIGGTVFKQNDFSDILQYLDSIKTGPVEPAPGRSIEFLGRSLPVLLSKYRTVVIATAPIVSSLKQEGKAGANHRKQSSKTLEDSKPPDTVR